MALHLYATVADLREHAALRGVSLSNDDAVVTSYIVRAQDYIDNMFTFIGTPVYDNSSFPRSGITNVPDDSVPTPIKRATLFAAAHLASGLNFTEGAPAEALVKRETVSAGKVETEYAVSSTASTVRKPIILDEVLFILQRSGLLSGLSTGLNLWAIRG